jgi:hypothetical protein
LKSGDIAARQHDIFPLAIRAAMPGKSSPSIATIRTSAPIVVKQGRTGFAGRQSADAWLNFGEAA